MHAQSSIDHSGPGHPAIIIGAQHAEEGRFEDAEQAFASAVLQEPTLHIARFQLGLVQWAMGRAGAALVTWRPLADMPPGVDLGHFARAFSHWCAEDIAIAVEEFRAGGACCSNAALAQDMHALERSLSAAVAGNAQHVLLANYGLQ